MRFSVVIPVYNVADYLTACVDSVLSGDCSDYEIILVDDGSTDNRSGPLCDALAARSVRRVCRTVQVADTGITPGSGVGNAREALNAQTLGVPVIAIGVPTVVDAATLTRDVLAQAGREELEPHALGEAGGGLIVTPRDIDTQVHDLAKVIGYGINLALHPGLTIQDVELFLS